VTKVIIEGVHFYPTTFKLSFDKADSVMINYEGCIGCFSEQEWRDSIEMESGYDIDWKSSEGKMTILHNRLQFTELCNDNSI